MSGRRGERKRVEEGVPPEDRPIVGGRPPLPLAITRYAPLRRAVPRFREDPAAAGRRVQAAGLRLEEDRPHQVVRGSFDESFRRPRRTRPATLPVGARVVDPAVQLGQKALGTVQGGCGSRRRPFRFPGDHGGSSSPYRRRKCGGHLHASERRAPAVGCLLPPCLPAPRIIPHPLHPPRRLRDRPQCHGGLPARPLQDERALPGVGTGRRFGPEVELHARVAPVRRVWTHAGDHPVPILQLPAPPVGRREDEAEPDSVVGSGREHEPGPAARFERPDLHQGNPLIRFLLMASGVLHRFAVPGSYRYTVNRRTS